MHAPPITDEQLRMAWRHVSRPGWPSTLEAALAQPHYAACLRGIARNLHRRGLDRMPPEPARAAPQLGLFNEPEPAHERPRQRHRRSRG